jgi:pantoate--beta-alanine ligase
MLTFKTIPDIKNFLADFRNTQKDQLVGFVPTMGALHQGHISLIESSKRIDAITVCSIFVNPAQFNNPADLEKYPRTPEADAAMLEKAGCDVLFIPDEEEMYPEKITANYDFKGLDTVMEGAFRPGHFNGVAIGVNRLFEIVEPDNAYFGEKDFQQLAIIKQLVNQKNIPVTIVPCPIVRESDGLAMSSRNVRLTPEQRKAAPYIYKTLKSASILYKNTKIEMIKKIVADTLNIIPEMKLEYFEVVDSQTLLPVNDDNRTRITEPIACIAVYLGEVRLIDNLKFY